MTTVHSMELEGVNQVRLHMWWSVQFWDRTWLWCRLVHQLFIVWKAYNFRVWISDHINLVAYLDVSYGSTRVSQVVLLYFGLTSLCNSCIFSLVYKQWWALKEKWLFSLGKIYRSHWCHYISVHNQWEWEGDAKVELYCFKNNVIKNLKSVLVIIAHYLQCSN